MVNKELDIYETFLNLGRFQGSTCAVTTFELFDCNLQLRSACKGKRLILGQKLITYLSYFQR